MGSFGGKGGGGGRGATAEGCPAPFSPSRSTAVNGMLILRADYMGGRRLQHVAPENR